MTSKHIKLSLIIPVYNRPDEIDELLNSLSGQTQRDFEVLIVEDGSAVRCDEVVKKYQAALDIRYFFKHNTGPGLTRNFGADRAKGNYFIFLDSDCIIPPGYIETVLRALTADYADAFGGPDTMHKSFTRWQKAVNYAMTSFFTTGGIRGGGESLDTFHPRSFNMGISKEVYEKTGGFPSARFAHVRAAGEDIELSLQIRKLGFSVRLIKEAFVYHKRRTGLSSFFRQTYNFGMARVMLFKRNSGALKPVHVLPSLFTLGLIFLVVVSVVISIYFLVPLLLFLLLLFIDAAARTKSLPTGALSVVAAGIQLTGYGAGFIAAFWKMIILGRQPAQ